MSTVIRVENLSKYYRLGLISGRTLRDDVHRWWARVRKQPDPLLKIGQEDRQNGNGEYLWALRDINLEVQQGEIVGIIGRNGAGKSTLLKILSRITAPTSGQVKVKGRIASLLEVGTGFHPELTGRENIYLNGAILGMKKAEIDRKFDEIVAFAEVEKFIDTPVKRYSSGMYVRLAFAVAAHLEPEILIVDEVLAVGDAAFQKKCLGKMGEVAMEGRTVLFVSHNMAAVQSLCSIAYLVSNGSLVANGSVSDVIGRYLQTEDHFENIALVDRTDRQGNCKLRFIEFAISSAGQKTTAALFGAPVSFIIKYHGNPPLRNVHVSMGFNTPLGEGALYLGNDLIGKYFDDLPPSGAFVCVFEKLPLLPGIYTVNLYCTVNGILADWVVDAVRIHVGEGDYYGTGKVPPKGYGKVVVPYEWNFIQS